MFFQEGTSTTRSPYVMLAPREAGASIIHEQNQRLKPETDLSKKMGGGEVSWEKISRSLGFLGVFRIFSMAGGS